ncbi:tandem-95 repeat protein, partial [Oleiphilus sp. HI0086]
SISYEVSDGNGSTATSSVFVTVNPENDAPVAVFDTAATQEDTSVTIDVLANDSDIDGDSLSVSSASAVSGAVVINGDGTLSYSPNADFNGLDSISYEISDGNGGTMTSSVSVTVNPENDAPVAVADAAATQEDTSVTINVLANDGDIDGDSLSISSASASNGAVVINGDGTLNYTPNADFNGLDSISYEISDGNGGTGASSVSVTVNPENDVPVAVVDTAVTQEDASVTIDVLANDGDIDGDSLSISSASASNGAVAINGDGTLSYAPNSDFNGLDSISYEVSDGNGGTATSSVSVTVNPENDAPVSISDTAVTDEDTAVVIDVLVNDRDIDGDSLSVVAAAAISGVVAINGDGTISYTPSANFVGEDSITYEVSDGNGGVANSTVA